MRLLPRQSLYQRPRRASILIAAIWILVILAILSTGLYKIMSSRLLLSKALEKRLLCRYAALALCVYTQSKQEIDGTLHDSLSELGGLTVKQLGNLECTFNTFDEESKININTCSKETLEKLPGFNQELAEAVIGSGLRPFFAKEQILFVEGVSNEVFSECKNFITVYGQGKININTAPPETLSALGLDSGLITVIEDFRKGPDSQIGTEDDGVFGGTGTVAETLKQFSGLSEEQEKNLNQAISQGLLDVISENFFLDIQTKIFNKPAMKYNIVLDTERVKYWRER
ncbi:MAG: helix-hairpin-helix domain-containing protein [Candidatus Omnitrophica bacterium]|nr:helix-hairpin-helix domain-containing protein [Candidatus Omnitrophota bacterium]